MRFWSSRPLGVALICLLASSRLSAQQIEAPDNNDEALKQLTLEQLSAVQITSITKDPVAAFQTPAAIGVITSRDIRRLGVRTLPDLLRLIPGVNVAQIDSSEWAVGIRGFQGKLSKSVLVLIDGRSVYTPLFAGVYWDAQDVLMEDIDRVEIIRGPGGTIWGSNSVNGVINIITKNARETRGSLVSVGGGNTEQGFIDWRYGAGTDQLSYRLFGKAFNRSAQERAGGGNYDDWQRGQAGARVDWQINGREALTIQGDLYAAKAGQLLQISQFSPPSSTAEQDDRYLNGQNVMATWRRVLSSEADVQLRVYFDRTERHELNYKETRHTLDLDFVQHASANRNHVTWGLGARLSPSDFTMQVPSVDFQPHNQTYRIFSGSFEDEVLLARNRLSVTGGVKIEHTSLSGFNYQPSARVSWTPDQGQTVWGAYTRAVRTASRIEDGFVFSALLNPSPPTYVRLVGDGKFEPEELNGFEMGYRKYITQRGFVSVSLFRNRYDDLLSVELQNSIVETNPQPDHTVLPLLLRNGIKATTTGGEVATLWDMAYWLRTRASYSLVRLDAKRKEGSNDASTVGQLEGDTPQHKVVLQGLLSLPKKFEANLAYRYVSSVPDQKTPGYSTGDVRVGRPVGEHFQIELVGRDLLQPSHQEYLGPPGGPVRVKRSGYISLTWSQ